MKHVVTSLAAFATVAFLASCQSSRNADTYPQASDSNDAYNAPYGDDGANPYGEGEYFSPYNPPPGPYPQNSDYVEVVSVTPDPYAGTDPVEIVSSEMPKPPAPPTPPSYASTPTARYKVISGDTLFSISRRHGTSVDALKQANSLDSNLIRPGDVLAIP